MRTTDLIVIGGVLLGAIVAAAGLSQLDPRVREHFGREQTVGRTALLAAGLVVVGLAIVLIAIG